MSKDQVSFLKDGPSSGNLLLLAHGSGAPMDSEFMNKFAGQLAERNVAVWRFEFAYMAQRRVTGKKPPPPRAEKLIEEFKNVVAQVQANWNGTVYIGGKSLGGRVASMLCEEAFQHGIISGLVCLGYPFHPPGKPEKLRTAHLETLKCPALIVQGERDPFGNSEEVPAYTLSKTIDVTWAPFGNHGLAPPKKSGHTEDGNLSLSADAIASFMGNS